MTGIIRAFEENETPAETIVRNIKMQRIEDELDDLILEKSNLQSNSPIAYKKYDELSSYELEVISGRKNFIYENTIFLHAPSPTHEEMISTMAHVIFQNEILCSKEEFLWRHNSGILLAGLYSCGAIKVKIPDFALERVTANDKKIILVGEVAFRNENPSHLLIETGEHLSEIALAQFCFSIRISPSPPFSIDFSIYERVVLSDDAKRGEVKNLFIEKRNQGRVECSLPDFSRTFENVCEQLQIRRIFHRLITEENYLEDFSFSLPGEAFDLEGDVITFTVSGASISRVRTEFYNHFENLAHGIPNF